jgi:hypothetical protein
MSFGKGEFPKLPPRKEVGYLDPEIAGEGQQVIHSDGEVVNWSPPPVKPVVPDFSQIKSIRKYFNRTGFVAWPAWLYHPIEEPRLVKNAEEAHALGVIYRDTTPDERARYGKNAMWDWSDETEWRPTPFPKDIKFNPEKPGTGKTVIHGKPNPEIAQNELVKALIPEVARAVAEALGAARPNAPSNVDPGEWAEFQQYIAWKKSQEVIVHEAEKAQEANALATSLTHEQELSMWREEAETLGLKVDGRWSIERIKAEIEKQQAA